MTFRYYIFLLFLGIFFITKANAQKTTGKVKSIPKTQNDTINDSESISDTSIVVPDDFDSSLDFLLYTWANDKLITRGCSEKVDPEVTDAQYITRLKKLPRVIEMPFNPVVKSFIELYTTQRRPQIEYMLGLSKYYFPIFEDELAAAKIPLELRYLPVIESALTPTAVSRAGAGGLWQFMISTGRMYDLEINSLVDERFDPVKSTKVAVKYLKELYDIYGDWNLAIAAYNCGPGNVNKAIRRANGKRDFWEIYPYLPRETRSYVPIFIAANYVMTYYKDHNLCPARVNISAMTDTIMVNKRIYFEQISSVLNISIDELRLLNPQYKRDVVPGDIKPYAICLPINYANQFIVRQNEIIEHNADTFDTRRTEITPKVTQENPNKHSRTYTKQTESEYTNHIVRKGQTLGSIARKYHVTIAQIKKWNKMKNSEIKQGQRLKIRKK